MKTLVMILGGQAVGKMTVGEELEKIVPFKLFHNHMTVELANHFYGFTSSSNDPLEIEKRLAFRDLRDRLRLVILDNIAKGPIPGIIFTGAMYYDTEEVWNIISSYIKIFQDGAKEKNKEFKLFVVELVCDDQERFKRNVSENRLQKKPSKNNVEWTTNEIKEQIKTKRIIANKKDIARFKANGFISINNTFLSPKEVAWMIKKEFNL